MKSKEWMPITSGKVIKADDVITIDGADHEIHRLLSMDNDGLCSVLSVTSWIRDHPGCNALRQQFKKPNDALTYFGSWLEDRSELKIGLEAIRSIAEFEDFIQAFEGVPSALMPIYSILAALVKSKINTPIQTCYEIFLHNLYGRTDSRKMRELLLYLSSKYKDATHTEKTLYKTWFNNYLRAAVNYGVIQEVLRDIVLLNQIGHWVPASRIAWPGEGISKKDQLDLEQSSILHESLHSAVPLEVCEGLHVNEVTELPLDYEASAIEIIDLLSLFDQFAPREMLGAIGALLGDFGPIKQWTERMLGRYTIEAIRSQMFEQTSYGYSDAIIQQLGEMRFIAEIVEGKNTELQRSPKTISRPRLKKDLIVCFLEMGV